MNLNQYTDRIILILKQIPTDRYDSIWEACCNDDEIGNNKLNKTNIELLDMVFKDDIQKLKQENIINLWKCTDDGDVHECSYLGDPPEYEGDILFDIKNEIIQLIMLDIRSFK